MLFTQEFVNYGLLTVQHCALDDIDVSALDAFS